MLALAGCSFGGDGDDGGQSAVDEARYVVELGRVGEDDPEPVGRAGLSGAATDGTEVVIELDEPPADVLTGDVRSGGCVAGVRSSGLYPLDDILGGRSTTVIDVELRDLLRGDYMILIRPVGQQSVQEGICGDIALAEEN